MALKRAECYEALFRLKTEKKLDIEEPLRDLASSSKVPKKVLDFIEKNSSRTLDDFIDVIARGKPFFQNLCFNYEDNVSVYVKALLSMLTHIKITLDKNPELRESINKIFDISEIMKKLEINLIYGNNDEDIIELAHRLRLIFLKTDELDNGGI